VNGGAGQARETHGRFLSAKRLLSSILSRISVQGKPSLRSIPSAAKMLKTPERERADRVAVCKVAHESVVRRSAAVWMLAMICWAAPMAARRAEKSRGEGTSVSTRSKRQGTASVVT
jgi:hypothetical protein